MKVVVVTHNYIRRQGDLTALYLHRLSSGLIKKGVEITVIAPHAPGLLREDIIDGVKIIRFPYPFSAKRPIAYSGNMHEQVAGSLFAKIVFLLFLRSFYKYALKICKEVNPDLIWANWWAPPGFIASRIAKKLNIPLVISSHGTDLAILAKFGFARRLAKTVYNHASFATVVSSFLKKRLADNVSVISEDNVIIIPMPVGMETFPKTPFPTDDVPIFLSVARYTKQKHLDDIINAASRLKTEGLKFKIIMVGEGPLEAEIEKMAENEGLSDMVSLGPLVAQQKLSELYQQADCVLLVSEGEGFGLVLVEAGLVGRPVIGARSGGITDVIKDGENGLLIDLGDVGGLVECMRNIITDENLKMKLGENNNRIAHEKFSTSVLVDKMYNVFKQAVESQN